MKHPTNPHLTIRSSLTLTLALALSTWSMTQAQSPDPAQGKMMSGKMMERCEEMMAQKQKMTAEMKAQDTELTAQVAQMNNAPENKKLGLMAAVVTKLAGERAAMTARMEKGHDEMMKHMSEHMKMGEESMAQCPMMKDMEDMNGKSPNAHKAHQEEKK